MKTVYILKALLALLVCFFVISPPALANMNTEPQSPVLLTLMVTNGTKAPQEMTLDIEALRAIGETSFKTHTIWTEGEQEFTGVRLADFLRHYEISSGIIRVHAINDYSVEFPVEEALQNDAIIAYMRNGEMMGLRDKGPLWIVYPYDQDKRYQSEIYYSRSIWQLTRIDITQQQKY